MKAGLKHHDDYILTLIYTLTPPEKDACIAPFF